MTRPRPPSVRGWYAVLKSRSVPTALQSVSRTELSNQTRYPVELHPLILSATGDLPNCKELPMRPVFQAPSFGFPPLLHGQYILRARVPSMCQPVSNRTELYPFGPSYHITRSTEHAAETSMRKERRIIGNRDNQFLE